MMGLTHHDAAQLRRGLVRTALFVVLLCAAGSLPQLIG